MGCDDITDAQARWLAGPESSDRPETPYVETEALVAVMNKDLEHADALVRDMTLAELRAFDDQVLLLRDIVGRAKFAKVMADIKAKREQREGSPA